MNCDQYKFLYNFYFLCNFYCFSIFYLINVKWYTFICETAFTYCKYLLCCCFYGVHRPLDLWYCIWKIHHTKLLGGYVWHGEINITSFHRLQIWFYCEQFISISFQNPKLKFYNLIHTFLICFQAEFPVLVNCVSVVFHTIHHCTVVGTLVLVFLGYMFDPFTCLQNHLYVWVIF